MPVAELTPEQQCAIQTRDVSVALSAGAGCGKTFVLTQRFISHLTPEDGREDRARLGQLIAITFTDAAAREMRARIRNACYEQLTQAKSSAEQDHWLRLMREIDSARVSTIHAFCAALLRTHAAAVGLDPLFGVLDQSDADVLQLDVIDDVLREQLAKLDDETLDLSTAYGLARLKQQISAFVGRRHEESFQYWLAATPDDMIARWRNWHKDEAFPLAVREIAAAAPIDRILELLHDVTPDGTKPKFADARADLLDLLPRLHDQNVTTKELNSIRESAKVQGVCSTKDWRTADEYGHYRDACRELRDAIDQHAPKAFDPDAARPTAELGLALLRLTNKVVAKYEQRKRAQGMLDFDDLLATAYTFLTEPKNAAIRGKISDDLRLLLVDEFQDTDRLQAKLVKALCGAGFDIGRLFFVGDFKQSIYRFRGAEPNVFRDLRADVQEKGRLPLTLNFRSQPGVLDFVNALFCDALGTVHEPYEKLHASRPQITEPPCVEFLWTIDPEKNNRRNPGAALEARRQEARAIARRLRMLIDDSGRVSPIEDSPRRRRENPSLGETRPLELGDIAILFRTLSDVQVYEEALREYELDYYLVGGHAFYAQQEIYDVLNLLRAVASTADEVSLAGVLRSPFFALADETLFWLVDSAGSLNAGLRRGLAHFAESSEQNVPVPFSALSPEERAKTVAAADTIRHLRAVKDRVPIATLLGQALDRTGYDAVLLAEFLGQRKLANLHKLMERARAAEHGGVLDLDGFITQLAQFIAQQPKEALAATLPEAANVIRLMTIHHAKGLEFPLVVLPDLDRLPRFGTPPTALHPEFGPLVPPPSDDDEQKNIATGMSLFAAVEKAEELEERKRLLYVACTRAADYLILSSSLEAYSEPRSDWMKLLAERFNLETGASLADLPTDYVAPQVRVVSDPTTDHKPIGRRRGPDLLKVLDDAHELAGQGEGIVPPEVAPIPVDRTARRQFSFSRLTGQLVRAESHDPTERAGASPPPSSIDPRGLGTLVHEALARIDLNDPAAIAEWCEHLAPQHVVVNADEAEQIARELIERFAASSRGQQIAKSAAMHRELEFILAWPLDRKSANGTYLRGFIDCLYVDCENRWHLTDYKTDNITAADVPRHAKRYAMQLYVYAMAAERVLGQPPSELVLHFLRPGVEHVFPWNDAARRAAVEMVNAAIASEQSNHSTYVLEELQIAN
ncbi:MAG: UvrD-helicase domain-containing protein [Planctomycetes bacterium]|nr:UvrD-helicase domain-containing protein [Planctomycetota bacterium]